MTMRMKALAVAAAFGFAAMASQAHADGNTVKIGFITDMSGLYTDIDGQGGAEAIKMAIADFGGKVLGKPVELVTADHQNKADVAASKAREWFDRGGVDMLIGGTNSGTGLAMNKVSAEPVPRASATVSAVVKAGGKSWFFLTADYAFGHALEKSTSDVVKANGGTVVGQVRHPLSASDFSSYLLQAQSSKAQVLGLANAGGDTINAIKAAKEFGIKGKMQIAGLLVFINDIHSLGLDNTEGMYLTDSWYWDKDDKSREFAKRYFGKMKKMPSSLQAGDYSATMTYLKAVQAAGTTDADKVMEQLHKIKIDDMFSKGYIRKDGTMVHDMYLMQVKSKKESKEPWDYYKVVATIPGEKAFTTEAESTCKLK